jgi:hypothetical protein
MPLSPYRVRIRWLVDNQSGAVRPVNASRGAHYTPGSWFGARSLPLTVTSVGTHRSRLLRVIVSYCRTSAQNRKGDGAFLRPA